MKSNITRNWLEILGDFSHGLDLAENIGRKITKDDLMELVRLHKSGNFRFKIQELLTGCGFYEECERLNACEYEWFA